MPCAEMRELEAAYTERRQARVAVSSERRKMPASWLQARAAYVMQAHRRSCPICRDDALTANTSRPASTDFTKP
jgi:galactose-1-phosphate uridylyltransferase